MPCGEGYSVRLKRNQDYAIDLGYRQLGGLWHLKLKHVIIKHRSGNSKENVHGFDELYTERGDYAREFLCMEICE